VGPRAAANMSRQRQFPARPIGMRSDVCPGRKLAI
jgi:hypothetical protein